MNKAAPAEQAHTTRDTAAVKSENTPDRPVSKVLGKVYALRPVYSKAVNTPCNIVVVLTFFVFSDTLSQSSISVL